MSHFPKPRLLYFDGRGAAELSRILMHIGGMQFDDVRYDIAKHGEDSSDGHKFLTDREEGKFAVNMDRLPILEVEGAQIGQSRAIERFVSGRCHLLGKNDLERGIIDCITENVRDIKEKWGLIISNQSKAEKEKLIQQWFHHGGLSDWLIRLENSLPPSSSSGVYVFGSHPTYADFSIWFLLRDYFPSRGEARHAETMAKCTRLTAIADHIEALESLQNYIASRPVTLF